MNTEIVNLIGAGGHGLIVLDALISQGWDTKMIVVCDDHPLLNGRMVLGCMVSVPVPASSEMAGWVHAAVGRGDLREALLTRSGRPENRWLTVCHPRAVVSEFAAIGEGSFVAAMAIVGPCARLGRGVIVNHGAVVDHECIVGDFCHISPNATLGGGVHLGRGVLIGAGANVLPGVRIGDRSVIGAGAAVICDVPEGRKVAGVPARAIPRRIS